MIRAPLRSSSLLLLPLLIACGRKDAPPAPSTLASAPSASGSTTAPAPIASGAATATAAIAAASGAEPIAPVAVGLCDLRWGFHGKVAGQEAYLRLTREGSGVVGRYFYAKRGMDLPLHGTLDAGLALALDEGDLKASTGHFDGRCDPATGALDGTWSAKAGDKGAAFHFDRVATRDKPLIATKKWAHARKGKTGACSYEQLRFELFGAGTPAAERALNAQDDKTIAPTILSLETYKQVDACDEPMTAEWSSGVIANFRGLVTVESSGTYTVKGAAHPANAVGFTRTTYVLATGAAIGEKDLFTKFPQGLVDRCFGAFVKANGIEDLADTLDAHSFDVRPDGVRFFGREYPHVIAALTGAGPTVRWEALLREKALRADSPAKEAWRGIAAGGAPSVASDCVQAELPK